MSITLLFPPQLETNPDDVSPFLLSRGVSEEVRAAHSFADSWNCCAMYLKSSVFDKNCLAEQICKSNQLKYTLAMKVLCQNLT